VAGPISLTVIAVPGCTVTRSYTGKSPCSNIPASAKGWPLAWRRSEKISADPIAKPVNNRPAPTQAANSRITEYRSDFPSNPIPGRSGSVTMLSRTRVPSGNPPYGWNTSG
jgi:hypothetical protein